MSSPPTNEHSQCQTQAGDALDPTDAPDFPDPQIPQTPPPAYSINATPPAFLSREGLDSSTHSQQQSPSRHRQSNVSRPLKRPRFLWVFAIVDIIFGVCFTTTTMFFIYFRASKKKAGGDFEEAMIAYFLLAVLLVRYIIQFCMGIGLIRALSSPEESRTIFYLRWWSYGAFFLLCVQSFFLAINIMKLSVTQKDRATGLAKAGSLLSNCVGILFRALAFFLVRSFFVDLTNANSCRSQEVRLGDVRPSPE